MQSAEFVIGIEGIPFITRFKTKSIESGDKDFTLGIEGIPFITRFKTNCRRPLYRLDIVLKVFHL